VLGAFERGRSWPRTTTRTRIEEYLRWPPGTLARIRDGAAAPDDDDREETTEFLSDTVRVSVLVDAVEIALRGINVRIASLGLPTDHGFSVDATDLLTELRRLDGMLSTAATGPRSSPEVAMLLGEVRRTYHALMEEAARSPDATIGQRLYLARHRAQLSTAEVAHAAGVSAADVDECEAGRLVSADAIAALEEVIAALSSR
jgi:DNA-binding transcriptional regulator YiaG